MPSHSPHDDKPPVLKRRGSLMRFLLILISLFLLLYVAVAATGFFRNQSEDVQNSPAAQGQTQKGMP